MRMSRRGAAIAAGILLIVAVIGSFLWNSQSEEVHTPAAATGARATKAEPLPAGPPGQAHRANESNGSPSAIDRSPSVEENRDGPNLNNQPIVSESQTSTETVAQGEGENSDAADADSSAERPFSFSPAVMNACAPNADQAGLDCPRLLSFLAEYEPEHRNRSWAEGMEKRIENAVNESDAGKFTIRRIECRSSRCALEVSAPYEAYDGHFVNDRILYRDIGGPVAAVIAFEKGPNGERIFVTAFGYWRH